MTGHTNDWPVVDDTMHASCVQFAVSATNVAALVRVTRKLPPFDVTSAMLSGEASGDAAPTPTVTVPPDAPRLPFTLDARHLQKFLRL